MAYTDIGFDENLNRIEATPDQSAQALDPLQFDTFTQQISASKLQGGIISSPDGKTQIDIDQGIFKVSNGVQDLITLGILPDGNVGLLIKNNDGQTLMQVSGDVNFIQSANGFMKIDMTNEIIKILNEAGIPVVELGLLSS
jgi:hypothetical protein